MKIKLRVWRQENPKAKGKFVKYELDGVDPEMSFLEMLDALNEKLIKEDKEIRQHNENSIYWFSQTIT